MSKFTLILLALYIYTAGLLKAQTTYFFCDFSELSSIEAFTMIDADGLSPSSSVASLGFKTGKAWIQYKTKEDDNTLNAVIASTSSYNPAGKANDWLISPQISLASPRAILKWRAKNLSSSLRDGYNVFISTTGNDRKDFDEEPVFSVSKEEVAWTEHYVSLAKYEGQNVYIAFVNPSNDKYIVCIDDIWVGTGEPYQMKVTSETLFDTDAHTFTVKGFVKPIVGCEINNYSAHCLYNGKTYTQTYEGLGIVHEQTHEFEFPELLELGKVGEAMLYKVWVTIGDTEISQECKASKASFNTTRKVVLEEGTATWCTACPQGTQKINELNEKYPEKMIAIAVHHSDPLAIDDYTLNIFMNAFPGFIFNRHTNTLCLPEDGETNLINELKRLSPADINIEASFLNGINAEITTRFAHDIDNANYNVALIVLENGIKGYTQAPTYASTTMNHVPRAIYDSFWGTPGSVPTVIKKEELYKQSYSIRLPSTTQDKDSLELVALLIDRNTNEIVNANSITASNFGTNISETINKPPFNIVISDNELCVNMLYNSIPVISRVELINLQGVIKQAGTGNQLCFQLKNGDKGVHFLRVTNGKHSIVRKILL